jgi:4'-phosphopantetheinyl transferase
MVPPPQPEFAAVPLMLANDEVHVWHAQLDTLAEQQVALEALLNDEERVRANRFRFPHDRLHFALARGILRSLLAAYCGLPATDLVLVYGSSGKPALAGPPEKGLQFNLSHSHGRAVYAFTRGRRVGIDVEQVRDLKDADAIVERFFSADEIAAYQALPAEARQRAFFSGWARKEAFIKALGAGLGYPLTEFSVTLVPSQPARFVAMPSDQDPRDWMLSELPIDPDFVSALAVAGTGLRILCRRWPPIP